MKRPIWRATVAATLTVSGAFAGLAAAPTAAIAACPYSLCVSNVHDSGVGSLRQAILDANATAGQQTIGFTIAGTGVHIIRPQSNLPAITDPVVIDGYTQAGSAPATATTTATLTVSINGTSATTGLVLNTNDSTVTGLVINRVGTVAAGGVCTGVGLCVKGNTNTIRGNYVGVGRLGNAAEPNSADGIKIIGTKNQIGGTAAADTNVISGNTDAGVHLVTDADNTTIAGNRIGTDAAASSAIANRTGILIQSDHNLIGGTDPPAANVVSGNTLDGIRAESPAVANTIQNNLIGTTGDGLTPTANLRYGVWLNESYENLVGTNGAGNTISGNRNDGVRVDGEDPVRGNAIAANRIGLTIVPAPIGLGGLPNVGNGIAVYAHNVKIGGDFTGDGNSIATNGKNGILLGEGTTTTVVRGNFIGTTPTRAGGLGNFEDGVSIQNASSNIIGSPDLAVPPNVITSNRRGVYITGDNADNNPIQGNSIDLNLGAPGIAGLGIDIDPAGVNQPNDPGDVDGGPNASQNYPDFVLLYVNPAGTPTIRWSLDSTPMTRFRVEVFASPGCDPSGFGEGATLLSAVVVRTTAGAVVFDTPVAVASGTGITTTATPIGVYEPTSEFSQCIVVP